MQHVFHPRSSLHSEDTQLDRLFLDGVVDGVPEESFNRISRLASSLFDVPISILTVEGTARRWVASTGAPKERIEGYCEGVCPPTLQSEEAMIVEDATEDDRFSGHPFVVGEPGIRFVAGVPLVVDDVRVGALCVLDTVPRRPSTELIDRLQDLAALGGEELTLRRGVNEILDEEHHALRSMYRITAATDTSFEEKTQKLLDLGRKYLALPYGFVTRISDDVQQVLYSSGTHPLLQPGDRCPLRQAYCRKTIQEEGFLAIQNAADEGWDGDEAYETFGLGAYIGAQIIVEGDLYGTVCFAAPEVRDTPFTKRERTFVELMSRWASYELEQHHAKERLRRQNDRLESFASILSHDLRNPLTVAKGRLGIAVETGDADQIKAIGRALDRMNEIIEDVLALTWGSRTIEDGDLQVCHLADVAETCWDHVETAGARLYVEDGPSFYADESRLQQLLENLFRNAVEHGGEDVSVWIGALPDGFFVEDDGPGIPPERCDEIFEMGTTSREEGTGLGLSIVDMIAHAHGWSVRVAEGRTGGARFEITGVDQGE